MEDNYVKDYDKWNNLKKIVNDDDREVFAYPREVWWCSLGVNIGAESDGKNENFERPVVIMKVYNKEMMFVLPITSKVKNDKFHFQIEIEAVNQETKEIYKKIAFIKLTQARVISNKRLIRKVDVIGEEKFKEIENAFRIFI